MKKIAFLLAAILGCLAYFIFLAPPAKKVSDVYIATDSTVTKLFFKETTLDIPVYPGSIEVKILASATVTLPEIPTQQNSEGKTTYVPGIYYKNFFGRLSNYSTAFILDFNDYYRIDVLGNQITISDINNNQEDLPKGLYAFFEKGVWRNKRGIFLKN